MVGITVILINKSKVIYIDAKTYVSNFLLKNPLNSLKIFERSLLKKKN